MAACADVASDGEPSVGELRDDVAVQEFVGDVVLLASRGLSGARQPADGHRDTTATGARRRRGRGHQQLGTPDERGRAGRG